jgi:hypothetical protein
VSEYTVPITFKHISHARNWVKKWRGFCDGNDTLSSIIDQVEASFPRPAIVNDTVVITMFADKPYPRTYMGQLLEITPLHWIVKAPESPHAQAFDRCDVQIDVVR